MGLFQSTSCSYVECSILEILKNVVTGCIQQKSTIPYRSQCLPLEESFKNRNIPLSSLKVFIILEFCLRLQLKKDEDSQSQIPETQPDDQYDDSICGIPYSCEEIALLRRCVHLMQHKFTSVFHHHNYLSPAQAAVKTPSHITQGTLS